LAVKFNHRAEFFKWDGRVCLKARVLPRVARFGIGFRSEIN
jgi:hypothetical protein